MAQMTITQFMTGIKNWVLGKIGNITALIPSQASSSNKLADKAFVNSSIATATATFQGTYNVVSDLSLSYNATHAQIQTALGSAISTADNNDYAFVQIPTADATPTQIAKIERYKYSGTAWAFEYELNNSGFTASQWAAINSGATLELIGKLSALPTNAELTTLLAGKQNVLTFDNVPTQNSNNPVKSGGIFSWVSGLISTLTGWLENGDLVPAMAETLAPWADQKAIATPDTYTDAVRTTGGDIPIETSAGSKLESIKPVAGSKWTAKMLFNGSYNMLNAAKWGAANSQPYVGGVGSNFVYFLVPELTLGTFGTADENNGLLFTNAQGENVQPTSVYYKPLGSTVPQSLTDGTSVSPTSVSYDGKTYKDYATSGAGWLIIPKTYYDNDVCAHIAWEDWYDKYVSLDEPTTNPEAVVGTLILEGLLALAHSDKYLRGVNDEVCDKVVFGDTSATVTHMVDELSVAANAWTNASTGESDSQGNALYRHSATVSAIKQGGAACIKGNDGGIPLTVNGTTVSYVDTNATAPASVVFYEVTATSTTKAYTDSVFNGSNINTETGVLPINDCSIEAQVAMVGTANITVKYAKNIVDQVAINATVDVPQIKEQVEEHEERITDLEDTAVRTGSYDASVAVGLADNFKGDTIVEAEFYKRKTGGTQSVGSGIAAIKEMRGKSIVWNQLLNEGKLVDMGLPSGTLWASCNIDITQPDGFAASPFQYDCSFFSWGNVDGHNPISNSAFDYDWGNINAQEPYYEGQVYGETQGNTLTGNIPVGDTYDAARINVGSLWRMPTSNEFKELFDNSKFIDANGDEIDSSITDKRVTVNGIVGLYVESRINGARLFFSCSGGGSGRSWGVRGSDGNYWSSAWNSARGAKGLYFYSGGVNPQNSSYRYYGFALRPVINKSVIDNGKGGHKYAQYNNNISDLTLMFGSGSEPNSVADITKMFPLDFYDYNAGEVIPFAGQNLVTTGFNQWDEQWEVGEYGLNDGEPLNVGHSIRSKNFIKVLPNQTYYVHCGKRGAGNNIGVFPYDANFNILSHHPNNHILTTTSFTTPVNCHYLHFFVSSSWYGSTYYSDICINISDEDKNGTYEPYEKHTLPLDPSQWRDKNGDLVFPYGGMHGVGTAYDYAKVDADGYIRKVVRCFGQVDLGSLNYTKGYFFYSAFPDAKPSDNSVVSNVICTTLPAQKPGDMTNIIIVGVAIGSPGIMIRVGNYNDAPTAAELKTQMQGVMLYYELATPVEVELATPVYAKYLVDKDGTEEITPANGSTPYTTMANLSILYAMDARGEIKNLPKNYLSKESEENMLNAMVSAGVIASYTMTYSNGQYVFTFVKAQEASTNQVNNESNI